jgi:geranylgeranyl diphosphate synthase type II
MTPSSHQGFADPLARLDDGLRARATADVDDADLVAAANHHLAGGGRRRARVAMELGAGFGLERATVDAVAACVELLHAASLVHDDLQDRALTRRGHASVVARFGEDTALMLGDVLIAAAMGAAGELAGDGQPPAPTARAGRAVARTASGQNRDRGRHDAFDFASYAAVARAKSAPLFALPFELVLVEAGRGDAVPRAQHAAAHFALAYQLRDDLADVAVDERGGEPNAVLLLEAGDRGRSAAMAAVAAEARAHLGEARTAAAGLPAGAAGPLVTLSTALDAELEAAWT